MYRASRYRSIDAIQAWTITKSTFGSMNTEATTESSLTGRSTTSSLADIDFDINRKASSNSVKDRMVNMAGLEHALRCNPEPLQRFAAFYNFTGESISFLTHITDWKQSWKLSNLQFFTLPSTRAEAWKTRRRQQFNRAIRIYAMFISMQYAEFPLNLPARKLSALEKVFERPANLLYGRIDGLTQTDIAPFARTKHDGLASMVDAFEDNRVWYWGPIPASFSETVFDDAEKEIRYLVLTNTWPQFVHDACSEKSDETLFRRFGTCLRRWS